MSDKIKSPEELKYPSSSFVEELGSATAEAICASMVAANDDAPSFGPSALGPSITVSGLSSSANLDANSLAHALTQLRAHTKGSPFFKGKFAQNFRLILGKEDKK